MVCKTNQTRKPQRKVHELREHTRGNERPKTAAWGMWCEEEKKKKKKQQRSMDVLERKTRYV